MVEDVFEDDTDSDSLECDRFLLDELAEDSEDSDYSLLLFLMSTIFSLSYQISYVNWATHFISAYGQGLSGPEAAWANQKYHGHQTLPLEITEMLKKEYKKNYNTQPSI